MNLKDQVHIAQVRTTSDYSKFQPLAFNRSLSRRHLNELAVSFETYPNMISASPLIVNKNMEVVDGNHRLEVLKRLGLPVYYLVVEEAGILNAQALNVAQKPWAFLDFARSYAASGNRHYQKYLSLLEEYPMSPSSLVAVIADRGTGGALSRMFKRGRLEFPEDLGPVYERLEWLAGFKEVVSGWGRRELMAALMKLRKVRGFDKDHMVTVLRREKLPIFSSVDDYVEALETRYNDGEADYVRFK